VLLSGGATAPWARGRGAYRALVRARWEDAAARGTPTLAVQAGSMSAPILRRLGFEKVMQFRRIEDVASTP
jgi:predicted acetyltransferase